MESFFCDGKFALISKALIQISGEKHGIWRLQIFGNGVDFFHTYSRDDIKQLAPVFIYMESRIKLDLIFAEHP